MQELPGLARLQREYGAGGLRVVGIVVDRFVTERLFLDYAASVGASQITWIMDGDAKIASTYRVLTAGTTIIVDRHGAAVYRDSYPTPYEDLIYEVRSLLP